MLCKNYPKINRLYKNYKGGTYKVLFLAKHTTTNEILVQCQSIEFGSYHSRPLNEWFETVTDDQNNTLLRFSLIENET